MKVVMCTNGEDFELSKEFKKAYPEFNDDSNPYDRKFIKALEDFGLEKAADDDVELEIITLDDDGVTDSMIIKTVLGEQLLYVKDGKMHWYLD